MSDKKRNKIMAFMSRHMMACDEAGYLISKSMDSKPGFRKWLGLKIHLMSCHICRKYDRQIKQLNIIMGRYNENIHRECPHHLDENQKKTMEQCVHKELKINN